MKTPNNPAAEAVDRLLTQNIELLNLKTQTELGNKEYCDRLALEIESNKAIIAMLEPNAEWVDTPEPSA